MNVKEKEQGIENNYNVAREDLVKLMKECLDDARAIVQEKRLLENQIVLSNIATALFEARVKEKRK